MICVPTLTTPRGRGVISTLPKISHFFPERGVGAPRCVRDGFGFWVQPLVYFGLARRVVNKYSGICWKGAGEGGRSHKVCLHQIQLCRNAAKIVEKGLRGWLMLAFAVLCCAALCCAVIGSLVQETTQHVLLSTSDGAHHTYGLHSMIPSDFRLSLIPPWLLLDFSHCQISDRAPVSDQDCCHL